MSSVEQTCDHFAFREDTILGSGLEMDKRGRPWAAPEVSVVVQTGDGGHGGSVHEYFLNTYYMPGAFQ